MCDCASRVHPGIECSGDGCHCHDDDYYDDLLVEDE